MLLTLSPTYATYVRGTATPFKGGHLNYTINNNNKKLNQQTMKLLIYIFLSCLHLLAQVAQSLQLLWLLSQLLWPLQLVLPPLQLVLPPLQLLQLVRPLLLRLQSRSIKQKSLV